MKKTHFYGDTSSSVDSSKQSDNSQSGRTENDKEATVESDSDVSTVSDNLMGEGRCRINAVIWKKDSKGTLIRMGVCPKRVPANGFVRNRKTVSTFSSNPMTRSRLCVRRSSHEDNLDL